MRITNNGNMVYCRWSDKFGGTVNIRDINPVDFFQQHMAPLRQELLQGMRPSGCNECHQMEQHGKVSGRQRQLLKTGVRLEHFEKTMLSSPWAQQWSQNYHSGATDQMPQDWQIDLGNYCNSACVFCSPEDSSRLAAEWKRIGLVNQLPQPNWTNYPTLVQKFVEVLLQSSHIQYLHFIGGETMITPAFKIILKALIAAGLHRSATIGFTTNLTVWDQELTDLLCEFSGVNLGMSAETFDTVNDYVRWPSQIQNVIDIRDQWVKVGRQQNWLIQLRITPTLLTISRLLTVYQYAWQEKITVESCNFLQKPEYLRPSVLPLHIRQQCIDQLHTWTSNFTASGTASGTAVINTRDPAHDQQGILQDLQSYVNYLANEPDESARMPDAMIFLKKLEVSRGNCVLDYLPEHEQLFRSAGY